MTHFYELHNSIPALYPVYNSIQIADISPGMMDDQIDVTIEYPNESKIFHVDFSKELSQKVLVGDNHYISITLTPKQAYAACGSNQHGWITVTDTNIPYKSPFTPEQWMPTITASEELTIRGRVGVHLEGSDHDKAVVIMRYLREKLIEHMGTPSDEISKLSPLGQLDAAIAGKGRLQCNNLVDLFVMFCAAYGIIARRINLWQGGIWSKERVDKLGYNLLTAGGHTTAEIFDKGLNQWVWMDPMYGFEKGFICNNADPPLTISELQYYTAPSREGDTVCVSQHSPEKKEGFVADDFDELSVYLTWRNYLSEQQRIVYVCPGKL